MNTEAIETFVLIVIGVVLLGSLIYSLVQFGRELERTRSRTLGEWLRDGAGWILTRGRPLRILLFIVGLVWMVMLSMITRGEQPGGDFVFWVSMVPLLVGSTIYMIGAVHDVGR